MTCPFVLLIALWLHRRLVAHTGVSQGIRGIGRDVGDEHDDGEEEEIHRHQAWIDWVQYAWVALIAIGGDSWECDDGVSQRPHAAMRRLERASMLTSLVA